MVRSLVIANEHKEYVERLRTYIEKSNKGQYEIEIFYDKVSFKESVRRKKYEIVLFSPDFYDDNLYIKNIKLPIVLIDEESNVLMLDKYRWSIHKYTRISKLIQYMNDQYEEVEKNRPIIYSFYTPAGGVGKTTMALSVAMTYVKAGKKVLYINLEDVDSTGMFFKKQGVVPKNLLEQKVVNQCEQLLLEYVKQDEETKIMYFARKKAHEKVCSIEEMPMLIEHVIDNEIANVVIMDLSTSYNRLQEELMMISDYIMLVSTSEMHTTYKLNQLIANTDFINRFGDKLRLIVNQAKSLTIKTEEIELSGQVDKLYVSTPLGICEHIAQSKLLKLHGLV